MYPCGIISLFSELYGGEGVVQCHGILSNFFDANDHEVKKLIYDDACHLYGFSCKEELMSYSNGTKFMGQLDMKIDRLHIQNHTRPFCKKNLNPHLDKELDGVNTVVCEQTFTHFNKYKFVKTMNPVRFHFMFLYMIDIHNMDKMNRLGIELHPQFVPEVAPAQVETQDSPPQEQDDEQMETDQPEAQENQNQCSHCNKTFKSNHGLTRHCNQKHPQPGNNNQNMCSKCRKNFSSKSTLNRHQRESKCKD